MNRFFGAWDEDDNLTAYCRESLLEPDELEDLRREYLDLSATPEME